MKYFPFLRAKRGELKALEELAPDVRSAILPVFLVDSDEPPDYSDQFYCHAGNLDDSASLQNLLEVWEPGVTAPAATMLLVPLDFVSQFAVKDSPELNVLVDLGDMRDFPQGVLNYIVSAIVDARSRCGNLASFGILGTSIPESMSGVEKGQTRIPRLEWQVFLELRKKKIHNLSFADYGIRNPNSATDFRPYYKPGAKILYSTDLETIIMKGGSLQHGKGFGQYKDLASLLVSCPEYKGSDFSHGDAFIEQCAQGTASTGNQERWIREGTNHHITLVVRQLANLPGS